MKLSKSIADCVKVKAIALHQEVYSLYLAYRNPLVPWYARAFAMLVVAYALSPVDLVPDFIPILGYLDDLIFIPLGVSLAVKMIPTPVIVEARATAAKQTWESMPNSWWVAAGIIALWVLVGAFIIFRAFTAITS